MFNDFKFHTASQVSIYVFPWGATIEFPADSHEMFDFEGYGKLDPAS